jgi:hypothetical protein
MPKLRVHSFSVSLDGYGRCCSAAAKRCSPASTYWRWGIA